MKKLLLGVAFSLAVAACSSSPESDMDFKASLATRFKDPASLQFLDLEGGPEAICGQVNGKNGFGAYGGFQPFVFDREEKRLYLYEDVGLDLKASNELDSHVGKCPNASTIFTAILAKTGDQENALKRDIRAKGIDLH